MMILFLFFCCELSVYKQKWNGILCHERVARFSSDIGVSGQAVQPVPLASLKLSMAVYGQKLDGRPSR